MKIKSIILSSILAVGLIAGCASKSDNKTSAPEKETTTTSTTIARTTTTSTYSLLDAYISTAKVKLPNATRAELIEVGEQSCVVIRAYGSVELALIGIASDPSWTLEAAKTAAYIMGSAIPVFCPEYAAEARRLGKV